MYAIALQLYSFISLELKMIETNFKIVSLLGKELYTQNQFYKMDVLIDEGGGTN